MSTITEAKLRALLRDKSTPENDRRTITSLLNMNAPVTETKNIGSVADLEEVILSCKRLPRQVTP